MLSRLYVKNFALIEEADISFNESLNVLSGETGSGKSIILDSVNFVLGSKADKNLIRSGEREAFVKAEFVIDCQSQAYRALEELDIECDGTVAISRKYSVDGKGSIKINGNSVTVSMLKKVTSHLVDVHGQSEHFFLLNEDNQMLTLDSLCKEGVSGLKSRISELISQKKQCKREIEQLGGNEQERERMLDLLSYQINEIKCADIKVGELDELRAKKKLIENSEKIISSLSAIKSVFEDDNACNDMISYALRQASSISDLMEEYNNLYGRLDDLSIEAQDLSNTVSELLDSISYDEAEAQRVDERLSLIKGLIKKYGADEQEVLNFLENAQNKYELLMNAGETRDKLLKKIELYDNEIFKLCQQLTELRKKKCAELANSIESELKSLNIPNAKFNVQFNAYDRETANLNSQNGSDTICFTFSANKGEPLKPLSKVISGGEMSRFMLAIKSQLKDLNGISTYVFDEIDAGISGVTAQKVAEKFIAISKNTQIIAVSHLAQICASADEHLLIYKSDDGNKTVTNVKRLDRNERIEEIVRLTGGAKSSAAVAHADELLKSFGN